MKLSKSIIITISSILCVSSIGLFVHASDSKNLKTDLKNAIQTIWSIKFIDKNNSSSFLSSWNNHLKITTNNLIITLTWENANTVNNTKGSSILWWKKNKIEGWSTWTIIWWYNNKLNWKSSTLLWWSWNNIKWDKSVIIWGENNNIEGNYSTILWLNNTLKWSNSSIIWTNNNVVWNLSFALWSGWTINTNNAFLWKDWENTITSNHINTFSIISENGMVINTNKAADSAQLTISWSLNVFDSFKDENIQCGDDKWKWILKVMNKWNNNNQVCFCSCDWNNRSSILWKWQCEWVCKWWPLEPKCSNEIEIVKNSSNKYYLTWWCNNWKIVILNNNQSWYKDWKNTQYRACQTDDWTTTTCNGTITQTHIITPDPDQIPEPDDKPCNNCAKNGFPYCFPIDFSSSCNEDSYSN